MILGWIGLGKLGLPCAMAQASRGYTVIGTDANPDAEKWLSGDCPMAAYEAGLPELFDAGWRVQWRPSIEAVMAEADVVYVAVQTPHAPAYEGVTRLPAEPRDFEYGYLVNAVREAVRYTPRSVTLVIVSTVLPGTTRRCLAPIVQSNLRVDLVYSPAFIAMGTTIADWERPEFILAGSDTPPLVDLRLGRHAPLLRMRYEEAEMVKCCYNTFIGMKIVFANTLMEMAHKIGADCDVVSSALVQATERIISAKYMRGGMGDGCGCHPRDNIAMSYLADSLSLSANPFRFLMEARESQTQWLADLAHQWSDLTDGAVWVVGEECKRNSPITTGSPSRLLKTLGQGFGVWAGDAAPRQRGVFIIGVNHDKYRDWTWPKGSVVIDPWGMIADQPGVTVVRIGRV